jgi:glycosidase
MIYRWSALLTNYFIDQKSKISTSKFLKKLQALDDEYPLHTKYVLLNLMDSHDTDRLSSNIVNPDLFYDKMVTLHDNPYYDVRKPHEDEWKILRLIALFQMTYPGAPMIYYGTEAGMWGADDPDERKPMVWADLEYEDEVANISKTPRPRDKVFFDHDLFAYYKKLINIRKSEVALRRGTFNTLFYNDKTDCFGFIREYNNQKIAVVVNNSKLDQIIPLSEIGNGAWINLLDKRQINYSDTSKSVIVHNKSGLILKPITN